MGYGFSMKEDLEGQGLGATYVHPSGQVFLLVAPGVLASRRFGRFYEVGVSEAQPVSRSSDLSVAEICEDWEITVEELDEWAAETFPAPEQERTGVKAEIQKFALFERLETLSARCQGCGAPMAQAKGHPRKWCDRRCKKKQGEKRSRSSQESAA